MKITNAFFDWPRWPLLIFTLALLTSTPVLRAQGNLEYEIKAGYLFKFITLVEWPAGSLPQEGEDIILGVYGKNPFGLALTPLEGKTAKGRKLKIKEMTSLEELRQCQIVFISSSERERFPDILAVLGEANILTISETEGFAQSGGMINFTAQRNKVRFEVNVDAARRTGLTISSEILKLARIVKV